MQSPQLVLGGRAWAASVPCTVDYDQLCVCIQPLTLSVGKIRYICTPYCSISVCWFGCLLFHHSDILAEPSVYCLSVYKVVLSILCQLPTAHNDISSIVLDSECQCRFNSDIHYVTWHTYIGAPQLVFITHTQAHTQMSTHTHMNTHSLPPLKNSFLTSHYVSVPLLLTAFVEWE